MFARGSLPTETIYGEFWRFMGSIKNLRPKFGRLLMMYNHAKKSPNFITGQKEVFFFYFWRQKTDTDTDTQTESNTENNRSRRGEWRSEIDSNRKIHKKVKVKERIAVNGFPSHSHGTSLAIWDHSVTCYPTQVNAVDNRRVTAVQHFKPSDSVRPTYWRSDSVTYLASDLSREMEVTYGSGM